MKNVIIILFITWTSQASANFYDGNFMYVAEESKNCDFFKEKDEIQIISNSRRKDSLLLVGKSREYPDRKIIIDIITYGLLSKGTHYIDSCRDSQRVQIKKTTTSITKISSRVDVGWYCNARKKEISNRKIEKLKLHKDQIHLERGEASTRRSNRFKIKSKCIFQKL